MTLVNSAVHRVASGRRGRLEWLQTAAIVVIFAGAATIPLMVGVGAYLAHLSLRKDWKIAGPPCPEVSEVSLGARGMHPPSPFSYLGVHFAPQIGNVSCEAVPDDGWFPQTTHPVCQFSAPGAVEVAVAGRATVFEPGVGHPTTVTVRSGQASCVVGGWFR